MPIAVVCPGCNARLNAPDAAAGKTVKCPKCKEPLVIPSPEADAGFETVDEPAAPSKKPPTPVKVPAVKTDVTVDDGEEEDVKPRAKKMRDDDEDDEGEDRRRKKGKGKKKAKAGGSPLLLIGAIAGFVLLLGGGFCIYWFALRGDSTKETAGTATGPPSGPRQGGPGPGRPAPSAGAPGQPLPPVKALIPTSTSASRAKTNNNLKQIGLAFHNFQSVHGGLPMGVYDSSGKVGLSWRVAILPFIEQDALYKQFHLNEAWDSEHNKTLIAKMPPHFAPPQGYGQPGMTYLRTFAGPDTPFPPAPAGASGQAAKGISLLRLTDGTSNTAMVVEAGEAVVWTQPKELDYMPGGPLPAVGGVFGDGFHVAFGDGSVAFLTKCTKEKLQAMITANGGETIDVRD
jgi:hypothetical protein